MRRPRLLAALTLTAVLATACGGDEPEAVAPTETETATESEAPSPEPTAEPDETVVAPLTGQETTDLAVTDRPVLAVKVENTEAARPQAGLEEADVVYEELVEGGVTRFIALFHSRVPEVVGPVRSARLVDAEVLPSYSAVLAYSGAREDVTSSLKRSGLTLLVDDGGDAFFREKGRSRSHDLMGRGARLFEKAAERGATTPASPQFTFAAGAPEGAVACPEADPDCGASIDVKMSGAATAGWTYDADRGGYVRDQNGTASVMADGDPVVAANVVALAMEVGTGGCCDAAGSPFTETKVTGEGRAVVLRDGARYHVTWRKPSVSEDLILVAEDGTPFPLAPGATWIHLAPARYVPR